MRVRQAIIFSAGGTLLYALSQWLLVVLLGRLANPSVVGYYSLIVAVTAPLFLLIGLNLRVAQAVDAAGQFGLATYTNLQLIVNVCAVVIAAVALPVAGLPRAEWAAGAIYAVAKAVEAMSANYYGYFQRKNRMDLVARSMLVRAAVGPPLFVLLFTAWGLWGACSGILTAWLVAQAMDRRSVQLLARFSGDGPLFDVRAWEKVPSLFKTTWALGVSGGVNSAAVNVPRVQIGTVFGSSALGVFSASAFIAQMVQTVSGSLGAAVTPRMAHHAAHNEWNGFRKLLKASTAVTALLAGLCVVAAGLLGNWFIALTMGSEYTRGNLLLALVTATAIAALYRCPGRGLQALGRFRTYLVLDIVVLLQTVLIAAYLLPSIGMIAVPWAIGSASATGLLCGTVLLWRLLRDLEAA